MYTLFTTFEKVTKAAKVLTKLSYYKLKYGKRLKLGSGIHFRKGFIINISKNGSVEIGDGTFFNNYCSINCHNKIVIGGNNLFGESVKIYDHNHIFNDRRINMSREYKNYSVIIGNRNWFGSNSIILGRAKIGDNNVFGCNSIIDTEYGSNSIIRQPKNYRIETIRFKDDTKNE